jgi:uracil-DNA glycosylase family 4
MEHGSDRELLALLAWYRDLGVTDTVGEAPLNWLAGPAPDNPAWFDTAAQMPPQTHQDRKDRALAPVRPAAPRPAPQRTFPATPPDTAELDARAAAAGAQSLDELGAILAGFEGCALKATAKNLCFYRGAPRAPVMWIGEAPGREEDLEGKPFVGRAGQLLDRMLSSIGLGERDVHITNIVYWRPPGNRTPTPQEAQICRPFLFRQIELVEPHILVLLGNAAAKHVLGLADGILRIRGTWRKIEAGGRSIPVMATLHPAYLLRTPASKRLAWRDLLAVSERLAEFRARNGS